MLASDIAATSTLPPAQSYTSVPLRDQEYAAYLLLLHGLFQPTIPRTYQPQSPMSTVTPVPAAPPATQAATPAHAVSDHQSDVAKAISEAGPSQQCYQLQTPPAGAGAAAAASPRGSQTPPSQPSTHAGSRPSTSPRAPPTTQSEQPDQATGSGPKSWARVVSKKKKKPQKEAAPPATSQTTPTAASSPPSTAASSSDSRSIEPPPIRGDGDDDATAAQRRWLEENVNQEDFAVPTECRSFVIKSYSEDDVHKSIKHNVWASTDNGNRRLDRAWHEFSARGPIFLFFSVNASGQFCGMAQMTSGVNFDTKSDIWAQDKWNGIFTVRWVFIKDIPNSQFRQIRLENNEGKPVTNSRDTQEVLYNDAIEVMRIFARFKHKSSILDDFGFYDRRAQKLKERKTTPAAPGAATGASDTESSTTTAPAPAKTGKPMGKGRGGKRT